jgi:hypothetical protein
MMHVMKKKYVPMYIFIRCNAIHARTYCVNYEYDALHVEILLRLLLEGVKQLSKRTRGSRMGASIALVDSCCENVLFYVLLCAYICIFSLKISAGHQTSTVQISYYCLLIS